MKLILEFLADKNKFPIEYRSMFMHFLKNCLNGANDGKYYDDYYGDTKMKNFTFAVFMDGPQFGEKEIELAMNKVKMIFSTSDKVTGYIFYSSFLEKKHKKLMLADDNFMMLGSVTKLNELR